MKLLAENNFGTKNLPGAIRWHCAYYWQHAISSTEAKRSYKTKKISEIKVLDNIQIDLGNIRLEIGNNLDEVVVSTQRSTIINKIDRQIYKSEMFKSARGSTVKDVIRQLPSVNINSLGEISVRGSTGFSILLNGNPIQGAMSTILDQLPSNAVESIEFITAPSAKFDPDGKAGLINILTKKGAIQGSYGQINIKSGFPSIEKYGNDPSNVGVDGILKKYIEKYEEYDKLYLQTHSPGVPSQQLRPQQHFEQVVFRPSTLKPRDWLQGNHFSEGCKSLQMLSPLYPKLLAYEVQVVCFRCLLHPAGVSKRRPLEKFQMENPLERYDISSGNL